MGRQETGCYAFPGDWPGIFIRGDEALNFVEKLRAFPRLKPKVRQIVLDELIALLASCEVKS